MQNAMVNIPNGAICCKLWPKTISGLVPPTEANVSADKTSVVSADKTSVVSADKTSVVSADVPQAFSRQGRPLRGRPCENAEGDVLGVC